MIPLKQTLSLIVIVIIFVIPDLIGHGRVLKLIVAHLSNKKHNDK